MFAVKELMRKLSKPNDDDWQKLKRVARYLITAPRLVMMNPWQAFSDTLKAYTDADHAGCLRIRKSASGGVVMWGPALLKAWSRTQPLIALSSGESELAAVTKAAAESIGIQSVLTDFGVKVKIEIHSDAIAAIGICKRQDLGQVRHLATADLWIHQRQPHRLDDQAQKCHRKGRFMSMLGIRRLDGRPTLAPSRVPPNSHRSRAA